MSNTLTPQREMTFYFDYVSNNAYLAWTQLDKLARDNQLKVRPVPILFAGLLNAHGNVGPAEVPAKRDWMLKNIMRKCAQLGVPMEPPVHHPFDPLLALRVASIDVAEATRWQLIDKIFEAVWVKQQHVSDPEVIRAIADSLDLDGRALVEQAQSSEIKQKLRQQTEAAVAKGVFGIPSMIYKDELFFGYDDFPYLSLAVQGQDPLPLQELDKWRMDRMSASSTRSR